LLKQVHKYGKGKFKNLSAKLGSRGVIYPLV
jgi:hypothetical protein